MIDEKLNNELKLAHRTILNNIPDVAWFKDKDGIYVGANEPFANACGFKQEDIIGKTDLDIWPRELAEKYRADDREVMRTGKLAKFEEFLLTSKDGKTTWIETVKTPIYNERGELLGTIGIARDISRRKELEEKLRESKAEMELRVKVRTAELTRANEELHKEISERKSAEEKLKNSQEALRRGERFLSSVFSSIQDGISILDKDMNIIQVNPIMEKWYAHTMPLIGKKCYKAYHCRKAPCKVCPTIKTLKTGEAAYEVVPMSGPGGKVIGWMDLYSFPLRDQETGELKGIIEYVRDISERKKAEEEREGLNRELLRSNEKLKLISLRDPHTGLFNHQYLEEVIEAEFHRSRRYAHPLSVIMLDIDYFKSLNDLYGHQFGDLILKQFARQLKKLVRRYDTVVRYGGEEFLILSPDIDRAGAQTLAQRILDALNLYNFGDKNHSVKLKISLAVVSYPEDRVARAVDMFDLAERILNQAKDSGGNRVYASMDLKNGKSHSLDKASEKADVKLLRSKLDKLTKRANQNLVESIFAFAKTIELKDHYTGEHVENTVHYATAIARAMELSKDEVELVRQAAMLHDLGKIGISENILLRRSKLNKKDFEEIKKHPQIGADIIRPIKFLHGIIPFIFYHHERWDGRGYPSGIKGEEIPLGARIIAIADVYQALISDRPYRKAYSKKEALKLIKSGSGTQFDPRIVSVFLTILEKEHSK